MARNSKTKGSGQTRKQKIFSSLGFLVSIFIFVGIPLGEKYRQANAVDQQCTIVSAEVSRGLFIRGNQQPKTPDPAPPKTPAHTTPTAA